MGSQNRAMSSRLSYQLMHHTICIPLASRCIRQDTPYSHHQKYCISVVNSRTHTCLYCRYRLSVVNTHTYHSVWRCQAYTHCTCRRAGHWLNGMLSSCVCYFSRSCSPSSCMYSCLDTSSRPLPGQPDSRHSAHTPINTHTTPVSHRP